jgi:hypothetical protein
MRAWCGTVLGLLVAFAARAEERSLWINDTSMGGSDRRLDCGASIAGALRDLGYQTVEPDQRGRAALQIEVQGGCRVRFFRHPWRGGTCEGTVQLTLAGRGSRKLTAHATHERSIDFARGDVCRELVQKVRLALGAPRDGLRVSDEVARLRPEMRALVLEVAWPEGLQPLPVLKVTGFLQKAGYHFELRDSGPRGCRLEIGLDEPPERLGALLETFLSSHYRVDSRIEGNGLRVRLESPAPREAEALPGRAPEDEPLQPRSGSR